MCTPVRDVSLEVSKGEVVVLCGRSGSGKSTLLRCIDYLEIPDSGTISIGDRSVEAGPDLRQQILAHPGRLGAGGSCRHLASRFRGQRRGFKCWVPIVWSIRRC